MKRQSESGLIEPLLRALVVYPGNAKDLNGILHIAASEIQKREHTHERVRIRALRFIAECACYVALYEAADRKREP